MEWISVYDRLPEDYLYVLITDGIYIWTDYVRPGNYVMKKKEEINDKTVRYYTRVNRYFTGYGLCGYTDHSYITHWAEMPQLPTKKD